MAAGSPTWILAVFVVVLTEACGKVAIDSDCEAEPTEPPAPQNVGWFRVNQLPPGAAADGSQPSSLSAEFWAKKVDDCVVVEEDGGCERIHCDFGWAVDGIAVDAGELSATGGVMDITGDAAGHYHDLKGPIFEPGDMLVLAVDGSEDFAPVSVTLEAPPLPVVALPPAGAIQRSTPLRLAWDSAPGPGTVTVSVSTYPDAWQEGQTKHPGDIIEAVVCEAAVSAGSITMPVSLLSKICPSTVMQADLRVGVKNRDVRERDGWHLDFSVGGYATLPGGGMYWFSRDLQ